MFEPPTGGAEASTPPQRVKEKTTLSISPLFSAHGAHGGRRRRKRRRRKRKRRERLWQWGVGINKTTVVEIIPRTGM